MGTLIVIHAISALIPFLMIDRGCCGSLNLGIIGLLVIQCQSRFSTNVLSFLKVLETNCVNSLTPFFISITTTSTLRLKFLKKLSILYSLVLNTRGGSLINFSIFSPPPRTLLRLPRLLILEKGVKSPILFLCIKDKRQYLSRALPVMAVVWKDAIALNSCFEAMVWKDTIVLHLYLEVSFYKWTNLVTNIKHSFCLLLHLPFQYSYHCRLHIKSCQKREVHIGRERCSEKIVWKV